MFARGQTICFLGNRKGCHEDHVCLSAAKPHLQNRRAILSKKNRYQPGADNGFFAGCLITSGHYQPLVPVAAENDDYEAKNNDNKVDDGDVQFHGRFGIPFPRLYRVKN
jgi:hypothetical protein